MVTLKRADVGFQPPQPPSQITLTCPHCPQQFHLDYSDDEWNRVNTMIKAAETAIREDHRKRHEGLSIDLKWNPTRGI
jgi:hypothetical protein